MSEANLKAKLGLDQSEFQNGLKSAESKATGFAARVEGTQKKLAVGKGMFGGELNEGSRQLIATLATGEMTMERMTGIARGLGETFGSMAGKLGFIGIIIAGTVAVGKAIGWMAGKIYEELHPIDTYMNDVQKAFALGTKEAAKFADTSMEKLQNQLKGVAKYAAEAAGTLRDAERESTKLSAVDAETRQISIKEVTPEGPERDIALAQEEGRQKEQSLISEKSRLSDELSAQKSINAQAEKASKDLAEKELAIAEQAADAKAALVGGMATEEQQANAKKAVLMQDEMAKERALMNETLQANKAKLADLIVQEELFERTKGQIKENIARSTALKVKEIEAKAAADKAKADEEIEKARLTRIENMEKYFDDRKAVKDEAAKEIAKVQSGADIKVAALKPGTSNLSSIGGHIGNTARAAQMSIESRGRVTQEKIADITQQMNEKLASIDAKLGDAE